MWYTRERRCCHYTLQRASEFIAQCHVEVFSINRGAFSRWISRKRKRMHYIVVSAFQCNKQVGFLADQRRINVAVTRAKRHVSIICDSDTVSADNFLRGMLNHVESLEANGSIFSAEEFKDEISHSDYVECIDKAAIESLVDSKANVINPDKETNAKNNAQASSKVGKPKPQKKQRATTAKRNHTAKVDTEAERLKRMEN